MKSILAASVLALCGASGPGAARVETADARRVEGELLRIAAGQVSLRTDKGAQSLPADEVMEIVLGEPEDPMKAAGQAVVLTAGDDRLVARDVLTVDGRLRVVGRLLGVVEVPLETVRRVYLPDPSQDGGDVERRWQEMKLPEAAGDRLIVARPDGQLLAVDGVLEEIGPKTLSFRWQDASRKVARETVRAIHLAAVTPTAFAHRGVVMMKDGSALRFTELGLEGGTLAFRSPLVGQGKLPVEQVAALRFRSDNTVNLAELRPAAVKEQGYFDTTFHYRIDRSAGGGPLRLGGRTYRTGLGLHSYCELLYQLGRQYATFVATVGIDDAVRPNGDATITVLGDGRPLAEPLRLTGKADPHTLRLDVKGVDALLIRVDFGADGLDFSDHVDLGGARLIK